MYPVIRFVKEIVKFRRAPRLGVFDTHVSHHRCWPIDIDLWRELNNGRTLTLYDLGRVVMMYRCGLRPVMYENQWGAAVAGASIRYRRRIKMFERFEMRSRLLGWDRRFFYIEQALWKGEECANNVLLRVALTGPSGIVPPRDAGLAAESPPLPDWVTAWIAAEDTRPWPPRF
ncbi:acyl-CoA thioesterase [Mesobaculum littorinae]|uniref:Acyl-CoA thioesterase n=1 Tax=Mesobaculum littorinae TaxID=2486419 RepID=A0A438AHR8_9RHOB|nr:acyl-CoA thioesterase [Mesobaculum littorinae]RVV98147.1 acyl-CoA thioesterase [Mesobaculum littorinae]